MSKKSIKNGQKNYPRCLKFLNNSSRNTVLAYESSICKYEEFHNSTIEELIKEALDEQTNQVPNHLLKIIERIEDFQDYLVGQDYVWGTINSHITRIKTIYHKNRVLVPYIEPLNAKKIRRNPIIEFSDILTKDELRKILPLTRLPIRARMMAMIQGGLSNEECEHLSLESFIKETYKYHQCDDMIDALEWLADENNPIIWVTKLIRIKTGKPYYALIGAEAVNTIASAKLYEMDRKGEMSDKLLNTHKISINRSCVRINKRLGLGKAGGMNRLRPHSLRKFNATYISGSALNYEEHSLITNAEIDEMQGRGKTAVQDTYIKTNPIRQKVLYAKVMNNVSLYHEYDYAIVDDDVQVFLVDQQKENERLKKEVKNLEYQLSEKQRNSEKINNLRQELGEDTFRELVQGILNAS